MTFVPQKAPKELRQQLDIALAAQRKARKEGSHEEQRQTTAVVKAVLALFDDLEEENHRKKREYLVACVLWERAKSEDAARSGDEATQKRAWENIRAHNTELLALQQECRHRPLRQQGATFFKACPVCCAPYPFYEFWKDV